MRGNQENKTHASETGKSGIRRHGRTLECTAKELMQSAIE